MNEHNQQIDILKTSTNLQSKLIKHLEAQSNLTDMMTEIVIETAKVLKTDVCTVFTIDPGGERATQLAGTGYQRQFNGKRDISIVPADQVAEKPDEGQKLGLTSWILSTGKPFLARSPDELTEHPHHSGQRDVLQTDSTLRLQSFLGVPLRGLHNEIVGVIKTERRLPDIEEDETEQVQPFSVRDQLALETIARVASRCIIHLKMAKRGQETKAITAWARDVIAEAVTTEGELDSFLGMVVQVTGAAMRADSCGIFLKDESGNTLTQRAGTGSHALRSVIRAYRWPEQDMIWECVKVPHCDFLNCPYWQGKDNELARTKGRVRFKLTRQSLEDLGKDWRDGSIPDNILSELKALQDREFMSESKFLSAVERQIEKEHTDEYREQLLKHADTRVGLTAWIAATGKSFHACNYEELSTHCHHSGGFDPWNFPIEGKTICGAFLGIPLQVGGTIIGVVKVENISQVGVPDHRDFSKLAQQRFEILAQDIALAIMRLQAQIPARYRVIHDAQKTILEILRGGLDIPDLAQKVVTETRKLFNANACALFLQEGNRLIQPPWAASGWSQRGPKREYKLVNEAAIKDNPTPDEKVGLTVWIAVTQNKFTARSNLELTMHPHHKGTFDKHNFEQREQCESFMGFPLLVKEDDEDKLVGVLKVETKMKGTGAEAEYTYFNELDELVFELIANSAAIAIQNARLLESRRLAERVLPKRDFNVVLEDLYDFLQGREEVINTLNHTATAVRRERPDLAEIIQGFARLLEPKFTPPVLERLAEETNAPLDSLFRFLVRAIRVRNWLEIYQLSDSRSSDLPVAELTRPDYFLRECVDVFLDALNDIGERLKRYEDDHTKRSILKQCMELVQETKEDHTQVGSLKYRLAEMSLFERSVLGQVFDQWHQVICEEYEKFQKIPNPYIVGPPVKSSEMFRGREDVFEFIKDNLSGPVQDRTLVLHGQRRTGKTSILYQLLGGRLGKGFVPIFVDMQLLALANSTAEFLEQMAYVLAKGLNDAGLTIKAPGLSEVSSPTMALNYFLDEVEERLRDRHAVIMFDEFEVIEDNIIHGKLDVGVLSYLRSLIQHRTRLIFIFTGTHRLEEMSQDYWSVFFNIALHRRISFLKPADAARLICDSVEDALDIDKAAVDEIIRLTNAHPYYIQLICWKLVRHCNKQERNRAAINDVKAVVQEILISGEANQHCAYIWQQTEEVKRLALVEKLTLVGLAYMLNSDKEWAEPDKILERLVVASDRQIPHSDLVEALDQLTAREVLKVDKEDVLRYQFQIEIHRLWIKHNKSIPDIMERLR